MNFLALDHSALLLIQDTCRTAWATPFWEAMTDLGNLGILWMIWAVLLLIRSQTRRIGFVMLMAIVIDITLANGILKHLAARPRPFAEFADIIPLIARPSDFSFPSGHTACSFAAAFTLWHLSSKKYGLFALVLASLIAFSRLYLGVHFPSDVMGGILIGFIASRLALYIENKFFLYERLCRMIRPGAPVKICPPKKDGAQ